MNITRLIFIPLFLMGCSKSPQQSELAGEYSRPGVNFENALKLYSDGRYVHVFTLPESSPQKNEGSWKVVGDEEPGLRIEFEGFFFPEPYNKALTTKKRNTRGWAYPLAYKRNKKVMICFDVDEGLGKGCYQKIDG